MTSQVVCFESTVVVGDLVKLLQDSPHNGFPVIDPETKRYVGMIERCTVHHVLALGSAAGAFGNADMNAGEQGEVVKYEDMLRAGHPDCPSLASVKAALTEADYSKILHLRPYTNRSAFAVP